ncbi:MAG: hypothetical protein LQ340_001232 [Diploschistes diacapsis]|nr:MAG: hypothetical protein LQ340_001232 [Diploschistes diacapsis]
MLIRPAALRHPLPAHAFARPTNHAPRRTFLPNPLTQPFSPPTSSPQILHARRTLPYASSELYDLIADIPSYPLFLPFCTGARVLASSAPDRATGATHPAAASLSVGWKGIAEQFVSRVYCVPGRVVEAVSGSDGATSLSPQELVRWGYASAPSSGDGVGEAGNDIFRSLRTRWTLEGLGEGRGTEVDLKIEMEWKNMFYAAMSQAAAEKVAGVMVGAFEKRAREMLG